MLSYLPWGALAAVGTAALADSSSDHHAISDAIHRNIALPELPSQDPSGSQSISGRIFGIPKAAWTRPLGSYPPGAGGTIPEDGNPAVPLEVLTKRGIPLGGIGTGSFMLNLCGTFGPWNMAIGGDDSVGSAWGSPANSGFEQRFLSQAAFHVRVAGYSVNGKTNGKSIPGDQYAVTLATEDVLPAWPRMAVGQGSYYALFPKAWFSYDGLPVQVELKSVTPYVARDYRTSSLPVALFTLAAKNPMKTAVHVSFMYSFPNAPYRMPTYQYSYPREGFSAVSTRQGSVMGIRLQASSINNLAVTNDTEWVIAAAVPDGAHATFTTGWNANGDGSDLWNAFYADGALPDGPLDSSSEGLAGAIAVSLEIPPGETRYVTYALVWDFPTVQFKNPVDGTMWWKRYKEWYPGHFSGWDIAKDVLSKSTTDASSTEIEKGVDSWWQAVAYNPAYPEWLRCAALNELYYDVFGGVFWEDGCITKPKIYGNRPGQHLYFSMESDSLRDCESMDVRHYEDIHLIQLFPEIERDVLLGWADIILSNQQHITPHDVGSPVNDPWFVYDQYGETVRGGQPMNVDWLDLPSKYILQSYVYWTYTGDDRFIKEVYPACKATMEHLLSLDFDGDGIPDADGVPCSTYDNVPFYGANIYIAVLEIGALEAMVSLARFFNDTEGEKRWKDTLLLARGTTENKLWDASLGYFKMDSEGAFSDALMSDGMCGQMHVQAGGLPDTLPIDKISSHLSRVYQMAVLPYEKGSMGAVNMVQSNGQPLDISDESYGVWPGASYFTAALMYWAGKMSSNRYLKRQALEMGYGLYNTTYENDETAFWFSTPAVWVPVSPLHWRTPTYMRNRAVWELLIAVHDPFERNFRI